MGRRGMRRGVRVFLVFVLLGVPGAAWADELFSARLRGFEEVAAVSTGASGNFRARVGEGEASLGYVLAYAGLEGGVTQAHIHLGQRGANGGVMVFLCSNLGNGPAGTPLCPPSPGTVTGTLQAQDVIGPAGQGVAAGEFAEVLRALRAGVAYVNVHSTKFPGGEARGQVKPGDDD